MSTSQSTRAIKRVPLSALPLPPPSLAPIHALTPDPHTPSPRAWRDIRGERPSLQRRARLLAPPAHFSYVAPCPLPFPFRVETLRDEDDPEADEESQARAVERWLVEREALREVPAAPDAESNEKGGGGGKLRKYVADKRDGERVLIGLSETGLRDCLPQLDVGDAFALLGEPSLSVPSGQDAGESVEGVPHQDLAGVAARQELVDVLSGHATLVSVEDEDVKAQWAPWSLRYSGHQFGTWAGQLGDGRAISILSTPRPNDTETLCELQLKGAGRTPFSRMADGLAVLRSSIREFLAAEAMHALGIPTTRSLALVSLPQLPVERETTETACVLTRLAPSFIRIGSFEALNPPARMYFLGGGQQPADLDALRVLGEFVARRVLRLPDVRWRDEDKGGEAGDAWGAKFVLEVARRNARMVAGWQAYGFMHGVINTDNVSILGLTIDYGPFAFMDVFDPWHICNHSDQEGRYSYKYQPSSIVYALRALLDALAPLIGAEDELGGKAVSPGWANDVPEDKIKEWAARGKELVKPQLEHIATEECAIAYGQLMHKRLGLRRIDPEDEAALARPLLELMKDHALDFHGTFRQLCAFRPSLAAVAGGGASDGGVGNDAALDSFADRILAHSAEPAQLNMASARGEWRAWLRKYAARIEDERALWPSSAGADADVNMDAERESAMRAANPRFVLRQWVLEEVIRRVEADADTGKRVLGKVLKMASNPFEPWGREDFEGEEASLSTEEKEERRFCGLGERRLLGFQCSCSS